MMKRTYIALAVVLATVLASAPVVIHAQNPNLRWVKAAPFPEPEEELYGIEAGGKMYVIGGFSENGKPAPAMVYEYDPGPDKWTKKKPIPVPVHHQAQAKLNGKIYIFGGCQRPLSGPGMGGWQPVNNSWEYDPVADSWRALAPMPISRCSATVPRACSASTRSTIPRPTPGRTAARCRRRAITRSPAWSTARST